MSSSDQSKRGRPKKVSSMDTLAVRLPKDLITKIDLYVSQLQEDFPGLNITRADAIRQLLTTGLSSETEIKTRLAKAQFSYSDSGKIQT